MKPKYLISLLLASASYWMYLLYKPFLMSIIIASLLAISTSTIQRKLEKITNSSLFATILSTILMGLLIFAPLGYFLTTLTIRLNNIDTDALKKIYDSIRHWLMNMPEMLSPLKPYVQDMLEQVSISSIASNSLEIAATLGKYSASFLQSSMFIIIFYFFALYYGKTLFRFFKRVIHLPTQDSTLLAFELSSVMNVVFYSIIATAVLEGALFGIAVSFLGYNGLLFGILYGFASLIPVIGGILMWLPFTIYEASYGHMANAVFIALYSLIMISIIADTFIKPLIIKEINLRVVKTVTKTNELLIFFAIIAGLSSFGFWGMILGPAITAFFIALLKLLEERKYLSFISENSE